jgi:outer membrane protein assembly factor BamA
MLNEEFKLPRFNFSGSVTRLSLFWDYADLSSVSNVSGYTGLPSTAVIASTGVKLHADISKYLDLRFALGWRLRHMPYGSYGKGLFEDIVATAGF